MVVIYSFMVIAHDCIHVDCPVVITLTVHDDVAEAPEFVPPKRLGEEVTDHCVSGTVFDGDMSALLNVSHKKIVNVHMSCSLATGSSSVCFYLYGALIVLMYNAWPHWIALFFEKVSCPQDGRHVVVHCYGF